MYLNFFGLFGKKWCDESVINYLNTLPEHFTYKVCIAHSEYVEKPKFTERFVSSVIVQFLGNDSGEQEIFMINGKIDEFLAPICIAQFDKFINSNKFKSKQPKAKELIDIQKTCVAETVDNLAVTNNISASDRKIAFWINDFTADQRAKIINFLQNVDANSPTVLIEIDLSKCTTQEAQSLLDISMCAKVAVESETISE